MNSIIENYKSTIEKINNKASEGEKQSVNLVTVSKTHNMDKISCLLDYGCRIFGENKIQEAVEKWSDIKNGHLNDKYKDVELHFIGHLQTNKVSEAVRLFDFIQTIDRPKLAEKIALEQQKQNKIVKGFIQVNTGDEKQKSGISTNEANEFIEYCTKDINLDIIGLMCIPPVDEPAALHFGLLRNIAKANNIKELSMGMSKDYELAISMGATYVRVGSEIFGQRGNK